MYLPLGDFWFSTHCKYHSEMLSYAYSIITSGASDIFVVSLQDSRNQGNIEFDADSSVVDKGWLYSIHNVSVNRSNCT